MPPPRTTSTPDAAARENAVEHPPISEAFQNLNARNLLAGLQVTISTSSQTQSFSFGLAAADIPLQTNTPVPWLCAAKPLTSYTVLAALETEGFTANAPLNSFLPELNGRIPADTTVADCLSHGVFWERQNDDSEGDSTDSFASSRDCRPDDSDWCPYLPAGTTIASGRRLPGGMHRYDVEHGFAFAALVAERVTGASFAKLAQELLFAPLDMDRSGYVPPALGPHTQLFIRHDNTLVPLLLPDQDEPDVVWPGYSLWSTADDIARFYCHVRGDRNQVLDQMLQVQTSQLTTDRRKSLTYGLGIYRGTSVDEICHPGAAGHNGYETAIGFCERDVAVAVFTNGILDSPLLERMRLRAILRAISTHPLFADSPRLNPDSYTTPLAALT